jgi:hypothetical protein
MPKLTKRSRIYLAKAKSPKSYRGYLSRTYDDQFAPLTRLRDKKYKIHLLSYRPW